MRLCLVLFALVVGGMLIGCGEDHDSISLNQVARNLENSRTVEQRIDALERELRRVRARQATPRPSETAAPRRPEALAGFDAFARTLGGQVGVTVGPAGEVPAASAGPLVSVPAWSTIKVPLALRVLEDAGGPRGLNGLQLSAIERAITASDNAAAAQLFDGLAGRYGGVAAAARAVTATLRTAGDGATVVSTRGRDGFSPYGQTQWALRQQHRFMAALAGGCLGTRASRAYLLRLMGRVSSDRWGLGSAGVAARWKSGWGPGTDGRYLARQMGLLRLADGEQVVVTLAARPADGQLASAQLMASRIVQWIVKQPPTAARGAPVC